ncbi:DUF4360 domain-containing protein [Spirillospora sp. NBC_00431]
MMHARRKAIAVLGFGLVSSVVTVPSASAASAFAPSGETATVVRAAGEDCGASVSQSSGGFSISFSDFHVRAGGDSDPAEARKRCQVSVVPPVQVPKGFTYAITQVEVRGFADLATGSTGTLKLEEYFEGAGPTRTMTHDIAGPRSGGWVTTDLIPVGALVWKPCGEDRLLHVNSELRVSPDKADPSRVNVMGLDSDPARDRMIFHLTWKTCSR